MSTQQPISNANPRRRKRTLALVAISPIAILGLVFFVMLAVEKVRDAADRLH